MEAGCLREAFLQGFAGRISRREVFGGVALARLLLIAMGVCEKCGGIVWRLLAGY